MKIHSMMSKLAITLLLFFGSSGALACPHSISQFICPGDSVVDNYGNEAQVAAVNPFQHTVAYRTKSGVMFNGKISDLALGSGCLEAFCVGDFAVDRYGNKMRVVAVNPYSQKLALKTLSGVMFIEQLGDVLIGFGCNTGYCVGDIVVDKYGNTGTIMALSPYDNKTAMQTKSGVMFIEELQDLSSTNFCDTYGDRERGFQRFPGLPTNQYLAPNFRYYANR